MSTVKHQIYSDGTELWTLNDYQHRLDGPAVIRPDGMRAWWQHGQLHRTDGPAVELPDGGLHWFRRGRLHRLDGPAVVSPLNELNEWWVRGEDITDAVKSWMNEHQYTWPFDVSVQTEFVLRWG